MLSLIKEACNAGARKKQACDIANISIRTIERWEKAKLLDDKRTQRIFKPVNKLSREERDHIINTSCSARFCDLSPCQIVPILADEGVYIASESTFYRVLKNEKMLAHRNRAKPKQNKRPRTLVATKSNQVWTWDITYLPTLIKGIHYYLYLAIDIFSRKIVGWYVSENESAQQASQFIETTCKLEHINKNQIALHSDNGKPMKGATMIATLERLGVAASFSRPSVSNDNPYSESCFKTLKYNRFYPDKPFDRLSEASSWVLDFVNWYNNHHRHSAIKYVTPSQKHSGQDIDILKQRNATYKAARVQAPQRWSKGTRDWRPITHVSLNPDKKFKEQHQYENISCLDNISHLEDTMRQVA